MNGSSPGRGKKGVPGRGNVRCRGERPEQARHAQRQRTCLTSLHKPLRTHAMTLLCPLEAPALPQPWISVPGSSLPAQPPAHNCTVLPWRPCLPLPVPVANFEGGTEHDPLPVPGAGLGSCGRLRTHPRGPACHDAQCGLTGQGGCVR